MKVLIVFAALCASAYGLMGGAGVSIDDYPYEVSVRIYDSHICGGTIIDANAVLTAGHCVNGLSASAVSVRTGSSQRNQGGTVVQVQNITTHPDYNPISHNNDIALLRLATPLDVGSAGIQVISLADSDPQVGQSANVTGWGLLSPQLKGANVNIAGSSVACQSSSLSICAGALGIATCAGDSGGPLVSNGQLVGIIRWVIGCALLGSPAAYTKVAPYREWIRQQIGA